MLHTDGFDDKSLWRPQSPAHPRFPQHLQVVRVPLNEKHQILHPSLEEHLGHGLHEPLVPEAAQVLRLEVRKNLLAARDAGVELPCAGAQTLLVRAEDDCERGGGELDDPRRERHFLKPVSVPGGSEHARRVDALVKRRFSSPRNRACGVFGLAFLQCALLSCVE